MSIEIYVICLASYHVGNVHGRYIDTTFDVNDIYTEILEGEEEAFKKKEKQYRISD